MLAEKITNVYTDFSKVSVGDVFELEHQLYIKLSGSDGKQSFKAVDPLFLIKYDE